MAPRTMIYILQLVFSLSLGVLASQIADSPLQRRDSATGDSQCTPALCISAVVSGSTVQYIVQSTGAYSLGWMGMGFGDTMANSPMVVMWPNSDGTITLSQRETTAEVMPTVVSDPPRIATLSMSLSSTSGTQPKLAYTIPANTDTIQNVIWAFGTQPPGSSAVDAVLQQHLTSGTFTLDLTNPLNPNATNITSPASTLMSSPSSVNSVPLLYYEKLIVAHATLCAVGFLVFLPAGALLARYLRTFTPSWFRGHFLVQFAISGPIIIAGVACAIQSVQSIHAPHFSDVHKKWGLAIFILYFVQLASGALIHWVKPKSRNGRPPQNYLHAVFGLLIISFALYQVRTGYTHEWPFATGRGPVPKAVNILWYVWVVLLPVLYAIGLSLLPRQFGQERELKAARSNIPQDGNRD